MTLDHDADGAFAGMTETELDALAAHAPEGSDAARLAAALRRTRRVNACLHEALDFYADLKHWVRPFVGGAFTDSKAMDDMGDRARRALGEII